MFILSLFALVSSYDYNGLVIEWKPTDCMLYNCTAGYLSTDFNIHGLWPNNWDGTYPSFCSNASFGITPQTQNLLMTCWLSYNGDPTTFWEHEWSKHGTCVSPTVDCNTYFNTTANLYLTRNVLKTLNVFGIVPNNTKTYTVSQLTGCFSKIPIVTCSRIGNVYYLGSLMFCYDLNFNWIPCKGTQGNCGTGFVLPLAS